MGLALPLHLSTGNSALLARLLRCQALIVVRIILKRRVVLIRYFYGVAGDLQVDVGNTVGKGLNIWNRPQRVPVIVESRSIDLLYSYDRSTMRMQLPIKLLR